VETDIILRGKQSRILVALRDTNQAWYVSSLAKAAGTTYVHACNFINVCEELGIVNCEKHGKLKVVKLTDKGAKMAEMISGINTLIGQTAPAQQPQAQAQQPAAPAAKDKEQQEKKG
jgi:predicted transcriptional regulator